MEQKVYDVIVIGGGPAGATAALYCLRANLKVLILEKYAFGGQVLTTSDVQNYPGFLSISGDEFGAKLKEQLEALKAEVVYDEVYDADFSQDVKKLTTIASGDFFGKVVVLAMGTDARKLTLPNEKELSGRGISYCAVCDGHFFKNKTVAVVGGGNSAFEDVLYLSSLAKKTYLIHRNNAFRAESVSVEELHEKEEQKKIEVILNSEVTKITGENKLESVEITNRLTQEKHILPLDGLFIAIGRTPQSDPVCNKVTCDANGFLVTNDKCETNVRGVYAIGDIRSGSLKQIVTACSDGAIASSSIIPYVRSLKKKA